MFCAQCGTAISEGKYFCSNCGHLNTPAIPQRVDPAGETSATPVYVPVTPATEPATPEPMPAAAAVEPASIAPNPAAASTPPAKEPLPVKASPVQAPVKEPVQAKPQGFWVVMLLYFVIGLILSLKLSMNSSFILMGTFGAATRIALQFSIISTLSFLALVIFGPMLAFAFSKVRRPVIFLVIGALVAMAGMVGMYFSANISLFQYSSLAILASIPFLMAYTGANRWSNHGLRLGSALVGTFLSAALFRFMFIESLWRNAIVVIGGIALIIFLLLLVTMKSSADRVFGKASFKDVMTTSLHLVTIVYVVGLVSALVDYFLP